MAKAALGRLPFRIHCVSEPGMPEPGKAAELKRFVNWALTKGQAYGPKLLFSPIPKVVRKASLKTTALIHS